MADDVERSEERSAMLLEADLKAQRAKVEQDRVPFIEGDCEVCGNDSKRLVRCNHPKDGPVWACSPCRDKYKLPKV